MDFTEYERVQKECENWSNYYRKMDFPNMSKAFCDAAAAIQQLIAMLRAEQSQGEENVAE